MDVENVLLVFALLGLAYAVGLQFCSLVFSAMGNKLASRRAINGAIVCLALAAISCAVVEWSS